MKRIILLLFAGLLLSPLIAGAQHRAERLFYYVDRPGSLASLEQNIGRIDIIAPVTYNVDEDGIVWGSVDPRMLNLAKERDVPVMPLIHNPGFDQEMLSALLSNDEARARTIETLRDECERHGYLGIQFDFENLSVNDRDRFTDFFRETADVLHKGGFQLSIAVVHRPEKYPGPTGYFKWLHKNWRAGYDLAALAQIGDFISVMTYSQHTRRTPPGPNAGIPWVKRNVEFFLSEGVPPEKLSLGIPVVSQHWRTELDEERYVANARSWSSAMSYSDAIALLDRFRTQPIWLEDQGVAYSYFENGGLFEWVFMENAKSFSLKHDVVTSYGLRGFSVWVLGYEDPGVWDLLDQAR